jgi:carbon monoxide dehydrogenase subunit G
MATLYREFTVTADAAKVWDALRDYGALHKLVGKGFITSCTLEGDVRSITFANGHSVREQLVGVDEAARRICYTVLNGRATHHHASAQVFDAGGGTTRFVWITDLLPQEMARPIGAMMDHGVAAMQQSLSAMA